MARSLRKGPFVEPSLQRKVDKLLDSGAKQVIRTWSRRSMIAPDFVKLAEAHGLQGARVTDRAGVEPAVRAAQAFDGTTVIDFRVTEEACVYPMVASGRALDDMIRRPRPDATAAKAPEGDQK